MCPLTLLTMRSAFVALDVGQREQVWVGGVTALGNRYFDASIFACLTTTRWLAAIDHYGSPTERARADRRLLRFVLHGTVMLRPREWLTRLL